MNTNKRKTGRKHSGIIKQQESRMISVSRWREIHENKEHISSIDRLIKEREKEINKVRLYIDRVYHN